MLCVIVFVLFDKCGHLKGGRRGTLLAMGASYATRPYLQWLGKLRHGSGSWPFIMCGGVCVLYADLRHDENSRCSLKDIGAENP